MDTKLSKLLSSFVNLINYNMDAILKTHDLTGQEYDILLALQNHGEMPVTMIAIKANIPQNSISPATKSLRTRGLLKKVRSVEDERSVIVSLSPEGATLLEIIEKDLVQRLDCFGEIAEEEKNILVSFLFRLSNCIKTVS